MGGHSKCVFRPPPGLPDPRVAVAWSSKSDGRLSPEALASLPSDITRIPMWGAPPPLPRPRSPWQGMASVSTASSEHGWNPASSESDHADTGSASSLEVPGVSQAFQAFSSQQCWEQPGTSPPPGLSVQRCIQCSQSAELKDTALVWGHRAGVASVANLMMQGDAQVYSPQQPDLELDNEENAEDGDTKVQQPTLQSHGPQRSVGSELHDVGQCTPCAFYCFKKQGCGKATDCSFCHLAHTSNKKLRQQEWRKKQQELQKRSRKQRGAKKVGDESQLEDGESTSVVEAPATNSKKVNIVQQPSAAADLSVALVAPPPQAAEVRPGKHEAERGAISSGAQSLRRFLSIHPTEPCFIEFSPSGCRLCSYADQL